MSELTKEAVLQISQTLYKMLELARREGIVGLEHQIRLGEKSEILREIMSVDLYTASFLGRSCELLIDGTLDLQHIRTLMQIEMHALGETPLMKYTGEVLYNHASGLPPEQSLENARKTLPLFSAPTSVELLTAIGLSPDPKRTQPIRGNMDGLDPRFELYAFARGNQAFLHALTGHKHKSLTIQSLHINRSSRTSARITMQKESLVLDLPDAEFARLLLSFTEGTTARTFSSLKTTAIDEIYALAGRLAKKCLESPPEKMERVLRELEFRTLANYCKICHLAGDTKFARLITELLPEETSTTLLASSRIRTPLSNEEIRHSIFSLYSSMLKLNVFD